MVRDTGYPRKSVEFTSKYARKSVAKYKMYPRKNVVIIDFYHRKSVYNNKGASIKMRLYLYLYYKIIQLQEPLPQQQSS